MPSSASSAARSATTSTSRPSSPVRSLSTPSATPWTRRAGATGNTPSSDVRLWAGLSTHFIRDSSHNQIAEKLKAAFFAAYRYDPPPSEVQSWRNSLRAVAQVFEQANLEDHGVMLEYRLPLTSRRLD